MSYLEYKQKYNIQLNEQQDKAVQAIEGPVLLLAVPGSGKTTVILNRLGYMITEKGINPRNILAITYTVASAKDMKSRFIRQYGEELSYGLDFLTINSLSKRIIDYCGHEEGRDTFKVIEKTDRNSLIKDIFYQVNGKEAGEIEVNEIKTAITYVKNMRLSQDEVKNHSVNVDKFPFIYERYNKILKDKSLMDFDDQMIYAINILIKYPKYLEYFQNKYKYICVDEAQDTSKLQHELIKLLASKYKNLFMVGDEDQSIYGFRAAYPEALTEFSNNYPKASVLLMEKNYRSTKEIVGVANRFIQKNQNRYKKNIIPGREEQGLEVRNILVNSPQDQYGHLIKAAMMNAVKGDSMAVLYRNNDSSIPLVSMLKRANISFVLKKNETTFFANPVVFDISNFLTLIIEPNNIDAFRGVYYKLNAGIKRESALEVIAKSPENLIFEVSQLANISEYTKQRCLKIYYELERLISRKPKEIINYIRKEIKYDDYIKNNKLDPLKMEVLAKLADQYPSIMHFLLGLMEIRKIILDGKYGQNAKLVLSTIHSSKGLEYENVYMMDMRKDILPLKWNGTNELLEKEYEEERRLFYVGITRAINQLCIFTFKDGETSEFSEEIFGGPVRNGTLRTSMTTSGICDEPKSQGFEGFEESLRSTFYSSIQYSNIPKINTDVFEEGTLVNHSIYGNGKIINKWGKLAEIKFAGEVFTRQIDLEFTISGNILKKI